MKRKLKQKHKVVAATQLPPIVLEHKDPKDGKSIIVDLPEPARQVICRTCGQLVFIDLDDSIQPHSGLWYKDKKGKPERETCRGGVRFR